MLIGHWSSNGQIANDAYNLRGKNGSNVFPSEDIGLLLEKIIDRLSFPGQWVLDVSKANGAGITAGLPIHRNVVCLAQKENLRASANAITRGLDSRRDNEAGHDSQETEEESSGEGS